MKAVLDGQSIGQAAQVADECLGCAHRVAPEHKGQFPSCKRYPMTWIPQQILPPSERDMIAHGGNVVPKMTSGTWAFPPAVRRCGEFKAE